jgi:addiction module HigA family antidote
MMMEPLHPGFSLKENCIEACGLTITDAAIALGVTRQTLTKIVNGKSGISPEMALRISQAFGGTPEIWLKMQLTYDLTQARKKKGDIKVTRIVFPAQLTDSSSHTYGSV